jgi:endoribonuclease Dicer
MTLFQALIDLAVLKYLFDKFPDANSAQLSWPKSRVVSSSALATLAIQRLSVHKLMLVSNIDLSIAISKHIPLVQNATPDEIVNQNWKLDPPKAISDVFEAIMGAVLVDSAYNYERAAGVVEFVMEDVLAVLSPSLRKDPVSELTEWISKRGCRKMIFRSAFFFVNLNTF